MARMPNTIFEALRAGASGYLLKRSSMKDILSAIRDIRQGGAPMTSTIARRIVEAFQKPPGADGGDSELTERERDILDLLAKGFSNKEIADHLGLSIETVRSHLKNIYMKMHVRSRAEAVAHYMSKRPG